VAVEHPRDQHVTTEIEDGNRIGGGMMPDVVDGTHCNDDAIEDQYGTGIETFEPALAWYDDGIRQQIGAVHRHLCSFLHRLRQGDDDTLAE